MYSGPHVVMKARPVARCTEYPYSRPARRGTVSGGRYSQVYRGPGVHGAGGLLPGVSMSRGLVYNPVKVPGIVPGAAPMGGGACAVYRGRRGG